MPAPTPYWTKNPDLKKLKADLSWNFPEQKRGTIKIVGGNSASFATEVKIAEYLNQTFPFLENINNLFPDVLKPKLPPLPSLEFYASTDSGSFADTPEFRRGLDGSDFSLILGDLSKNSITLVALAEMIKTTPGLPLLVTRDAIDLLTAEAETLISLDPLYLVASLASLQKLFRALYYPRPLLLSEPLLPVVETLHKFTLSYPTAILTFHEGKILCANHGQVASVDLEKTSYSPLTLWDGTLAARLATFAMFNKNQELENMLASIVL